MAPWCSGCDYCTTCFNKVWTQVLCRFKSCLWHVRDSRWWDLWQWSQLEIKLNAFRQPIIPQKQLIIFIIIKYLWWSFFCEKSKQLSSWIIFAKEAPSYMFDWVLIMSLIPSTPPDYFYMRIIQTSRFFSMSNLSTTPGTTY